MEVLGLDLKDNSVVGGIDVADDLRDAYKVRVDIAGVGGDGNLRTVGHRPLACAIGEGQSYVLHRRRIQVHVQKVGQLAAQRPEVADRQHRTAAELLLHDQVKLMHLRVLEVRVEVVGAGRCEGTRRLRHRAVGARGHVRKNVGQHWSALRVLQAGRVLAQSAAGVEIGVQNGRVDHTTVVQPIAAAQNCFAVAVDVISEADAWSEVVLVARAVGQSGIGSKGVQRGGSRVLYRQRRGQRGRRVRQRLIVVAQPKLQRQTRAHFVVVLHEEPVVRSRDGERRHQAEALHERRIAGRRSRDRVDRVDRAALGYRGR